MKQKDIVTIMIISFIAGIFSFVISSAVFGNNKADLTSPVVTAISSDFKLPNGSYFNGSSIDLTQYITISQSNNNNPFTSNN